jgi:hypothetical protein
VAEKFTRRKFSVESCSAEPAGEAGGCLRPSNKPTGWPASAVYWREVIGLTKTAMLDGIGKVAKDCPVEVEGGIGKTRGSAK